MFIHYLRYLVYTDINLNDLINEIDTRHVGKTPRPPVNSAVFLGGGERHDATSSSLFALIHLCCSEL